MRENRSTLEMLGALLGLVILIAVLYVAVGYFRQGATEFEEEARVAGRPVTLAESLSGITETTGLTETVVVTEAAVVTGTAATTATAPVTSTAAVTESATTTETAVVTETATVTATAAVTATAPVTASADLTATAATTATAVVTAATAVTESAAVTTTPAVTTTTAPTTTNAVTATEATTATSDTAAVAAVPELAAVEPIVIKAACIGCHVIPGIPAAVGQVGPDLSNIGVDGASRIPGYTAEQYIRESLLNPNAFIAPECPAGPCLPNLMVQNLGDTLTAEEIDTLVAYLASLGTTQ
jgi:hypothetical protein